MSDETYPLRYTVEAVTEFEAVTKAVEGLREDVRLVGVDRVERASEPYWNVTLRVADR